MRDLGNQAGVGGGGGGTVTSSWEHPGHHPSFPTQCSATTGPPDTDATLVLRVWPCRLPAPPPLGCRETVAFHRPETPQLGFRETHGAALLPEAGVGKGAAFCFARSPTVAGKGRTDNSTYLGVRLTRVQTLLQDLHTVINNNNIIT